MSKKLDVSIRLYKDSCRTTQEDLIVSFCGNVICGYYLSKCRESTVIRIKVADPDTAGSGCFGRIRIRFSKYGRIRFSKFGRIRSENLKLNLFQQYVLTKNSNINHIDFYVERKEFTQRSDRDGFFPRIYNPVGSATVIRIGRGILLNI